MLDAQDLMRVLSQSPSPRQRCTWLTQDTLVAIDTIIAHLRTKGVEKARSRIAGDMMAEAMSQLAASWNAGDAHVEARIQHESSQLLDVVQDTSQVTKVKQQYPLSDAWMECADSIAGKLYELHGVRPTRSEITRALAHMAAREVRNVIHALH